MNADSGLIDALMRAEVIAGDAAETSVQNVLAAIGQTPNGADAVWRASLLAEHRAQADLIEQGEGEWSVDQLAQLLINRRPGSSYFPRIRDDDGTFKPLLAVVPSIDGPDFVLWIGPLGPTKEWRRKRLTGADRVVLDWSRDNK